jgi:putative transposase
LVKTDEQLWHVTRYLHLNAATAALVKKPEDWAFSSYGEYLDVKKEGFCLFRDLFVDFNSKQYREFVNDRQAYQRELSIIKKFLIDNYSG